VNVQTALPELVGELRRFGALADRIDGFVEMQVARYRPRASDWIVLPWTDGFYLFSEDNEGQRRGREVVVAFLGPSVVSIESVPEGQLESMLPAAWKSTGLGRASYLRRVDRGQDAAAEMLSRLEDMAASTAGRKPHRLEIRATPSDLLRDFRLALLRTDDDSARSLLDEVRSTGHVSAENLRYLRLEYLAAFGRWTEMRSMPHMSALLQARRPRAVSETLLRMVWWTELVNPAYQSPQEAFKERGVLQEFGPLLRSVRTPSTAEGRLACFLTAVADSDVERQEAILDRAEQADERALLEALVSGPSVSMPSPLIQEPPAQPPPDPIVEAHEAGRFAEVIATFLADRKAEHADLAVGAVLDSGATDRALGVLELVRDLEARGGLTLGRRARRDIAELQQLVDDTCPGWLEWAVRISGDARWPDASAVARDHSSSWKSVGLLDFQQISEICNALLDATAVTNADQLRASLDLLCNEAAAMLSHGSVNDFCQVVLVLLSEQDNFSEMVRSAYLDLLAAWLEAGPSVDEYGQVLDQTLDIWNRITSPVAVPWAIGVLEAATDLPCPDQASRTALAVQLIDGARPHYARLSLRERVEVETLAAELGVPSQAIEAQGAERDVWSALNGKVVGIYSLLPRAVGYLQSRLAQLCSVGEVRENHDQVATQALRALAERADYLIVDTWHAAHQATGAIDAVRPRERQILPRQRGLTGFLRALEEALDS
jgi:hypothetical protein